MFGGIYMPCKDCSQYDDRYQKDCKGYCSYYKDYYDEYDSCSRYEDYRIACKNCENYDTSIGSGYKYYCTYYKTYYYDDDSCRNFKLKGSGGCFLTSACCTHKGLADDCYQLTVLRRYRDEQLTKTEEGQQLIEQYYSVAPEIVKAIETSDDKEMAYEYIFSVIEQCVQLIEEKDFNQTLQIYKGMVEFCSKKYLNEV